MNQRSTTVPDFASAGRGTPQGSPISALLSTQYMRRFVLGWKKPGHEKRRKAYVVNYALDLVICCRVGAEQAPPRNQFRRPMWNTKMVISTRSTITEASSQRRRAGFTPAIRSDGRRYHELSLMMYVLTIRTCDVLAISNCVTLLRERHSLRRKMPRLLPTM